LELEALEVRTVPTCTFSEVNGVVTVGCDSAPDVIALNLSIEGTLFITVNDTQQSQEFSTWNRLVVNAGGNDTIKILNLSAAPTIINAGGDHDTIIVGDSRFRLQQTLNMNLTVNGRGGNSLTVNDPIFGTHDTITDTQVLGSGPGTRLNITYSSIQNLVLNTDSGADTVTIQSTAAGTATTVNTGDGTDVINVVRTTGLLTVNTGAGNDTFNVGDDTNRLRHQGTVLLHGGTGNNTLNINDQGTQTAETYTITNAQVNRTAGVGPIRYSNIANLVVNTGSGNARVVVDFASGNPMPSGGLSVNGGTGSNRLVLQGVSPFSREEYTVTSPTSGGIGLSVRPFDPPPPPSLRFTHIGAIDDTATLVSFGPPPFSFASFMNFNAPGGALTIGDGTVNGVATTQIAANTIPTVNLANKTAIGVRAAPDPNILTLFTLNHPTPAAGLSSLALVGGSRVIPNVDTFTIQRTASTVATTVNGAGANHTVSFGVSHSVQGIQGPVTVVDPGGSALLVIDDRGDEPSRNVTLDAMTPPGDTLFGRIRGLAPAPITYRYADTDSLVLFAGRGPTVGVLNTGVPTFLTASGGVTTVNVGDANRVQGIVGSLNIGVIFGAASGSNYQINVNDAADTTARKVTLDSASGLLGALFGRITGLAPAVISYPYSSGTMLTVSSGTGGATVNVQGTGVPTTLLGNSPDTTFFIGTTANPRLGDIRGDVTVRNARGLATLWVLGYGDAASRAITLDSFTPTGDTAYGRVRGLAPNAAINYRFADFRGVVFNGSTGPNTWEVLATGANFPTTINAGEAGDTINVRGSSGFLYISGVSTGNDTVNVGNSANTLDGIGSMEVDGGLGTNTLNVNDQGSAVPHTYTLDRFDTLKRDSGLAITFGHFQGVNINGGSGSNTFNVQQTRAGTTTTINAGFRSNGTTVYSTVVVGDPLDGIQGPLFIHDRAVYSVIVDVVDKTGTVGRDYTFRNGSLGWDNAPVPQVIYDSPVTFVYLATGHGGDTVHMQDLPGSGYSILIDAGSTNNPNGNTFIGPDNTSLMNTWLLDGQTPFAAGLLGTAPNSGVGFEFFDHIIGGTGPNHFLFSVPWGVAASIQGRGSQNTLDYSAFTGGNVIVDLPLGQATGVSGGVSGIQNVIGASGGPAGSYNILVGNGGNGLTGGNGRRNLLIAGATASTLIGGNDDDILIGGTTAYDMDNAALQAIMAEWVRTDEDYATRVSNLFAGTGTGGRVLDATTVFNNGGGNILRGHAGSPTEQNLYYSIDPTQEAFIDWDPLTETLGPC
jgi:hypothetical protein